MDKRERDKPGDGGPAFPSLNFIVPKDLYDQGVRVLDTTLGLSLRDYFAGMAISGLVGLTHIRSNGLEDEIIWPSSKVATHAYKVADALIAHRQRTGGEQG